MASDMEEETEINITFCIGPRREMSQQLHSLAPVCTGNNLFSSYHRDSFYHIKFDSLLQVTDIIFVLSTE